MLCPQTMHGTARILSFVEPHTCALLLQVATSDATVLKAGVGWGPYITVYENYVCFFNALIPGQSPV